MAIQVTGNSGTIGEIEANHRALRTTPRPADVNGSFAATFVTGTMAAGISAASPYFSARWTDATRLAKIQAIRIGLQSLTAFTAGNGLIELVLARAFTASDTGGTAVIPSGNSNKMKSSLGTSLFGDLRISSTAALTAGTRTLDGAPISSLNFTVNATANSAQLPGQTILWQPSLSAQWPIIFAQNEGFILRVTVPATGTWNGYVQVLWDEVVSYP